MPLLWIPKSLGCCMGWLFAFWGSDILHVTLFYNQVLNDVEFVRKMANSLLSVFPQTSNVFILMCVTLLTYGVIGMYWFGYLKIGP